MHVDEDMEEQRYHEKNKIKDTSHSCIFNIFICLWILDTEESRYGRQVNAFEMYCYRKMLRILWIAKRTNTSIIQELGIQEQLTTVRKRIIRVVFISPNTDVCVFFGFFCRCSSTFFRNSNRLDNPMVHECGTIMYSSSRPQHDKRTVGLLACSTLGSAQV